MNNDELKKKIIEIALTELQVQFGCGDMVEVGDREACAESIADALIAAGIGFDKSHLATFQELDTKLRVAEHRAEVAELVVKNLNDIFTFDYQTVFEQAEKELAEERK